MSEIRTPQDDFYFVRAAVFNYGSFIVAHSVHAGEDIVASTWESLERYSANNTILGIPEDLTTPTLDFDRTIEPVTKEETMLYKKYVRRWPTADIEDDTPIFLESARTVITNSQKTSAADEFGAS